MPHRLVEDGTKTCPPDVDINLQSSLRFTQNFKETIKDNLDNSIQCSVNVPHFIEPLSGSVKIEATEPQQNILCETFGVENRLPVEQDTDLVEVKENSNISEDPAEPLNLIDPLTYVYPLKFEDSVVVNDPLKFYDPLLSASELKIASQFPQLKVASVRAARFDSYLQVTTSLDIHNYQHQTDGEFEENPSDPLDQRSHSKKKFLRPQDHKRNFLIIHKVSEGKILNVVPDRLYPCTTTFTIKLQTVNALQKCLTDHPPALYKCENCGKSLKTKKNLDSHMLTHKLQNLECHHCNKKFPRKQNLIQHIQNMHIIQNREKIYKCKHCDSKFRSKSYLSTHVNRVHTNQKLPCHICSTVSKNSHVLKEHIKRVHGIKKFICHFCGHKTINKGNLKLHILARHITTSKIIKCVKCGAEFKSKHIFKRHTKVFHSDIKVPTLQCDKCELQFKYQHTLYYHKKTKHDGRKYLCSHCNVSYSNKESLKNHSQSDHCGGVKNHKCQKCGEKFASGRQLGRHVRNKHIKYKVIKKCEQCKKSFNSNQSLKNHKLRFHSQKAVCEFCNKEFKNIFTLKNHVKIYHKK